MRALLVYPQARGATTPPIGMAYIASYLLSKGHEIDILDLTTRPLNKEELLNRIEGFGRYDCVGISAIVTAYNFVKEFSGYIKERFPDMPVVVGNAISVACPKTLLENSDADVVVVDEGELTAAELLENIKERRRFKDIKGIWYKEMDGSIRRTEARERITDLDSLPYPAWDLIDVPFYMGFAGAYLEWGLMTGWISAVRGCPYSCGYCSKSFGRRVTKRSADSMIDEMEYFMAKYRNTHVAIADDLFMAFPAFVKEFAESLIRRRVKVSWQCAGRVNLVNEGLLRLMRRSGCVCVSYGIESGSQKILDNMNKEATVAHARRAVELTRKAGIKVRTPFMFGYVGETRETVQETVDFITNMRLGVRRLFFSTPYPGTPLYDWARRNGRIKHDEDVYVSMLGNNVDTFLVNLTDMPDGELLRLKKETEKKLVNNMPLDVKFNKYVIEAMNHLAARSRALGVKGTARKVVSKARHALARVGKAVRS